MSPTKTARSPRTHTAYTVPTSTRADGRETDLVAAVDVDMTASVGSWTRYVRALRKPSRRRRPARQTLASRCVPLFPAAVPMPGHGLPVAQTVLHAVECDRVLGGKQCPFAGGHRGGSCCCRLLLTECGPDGPDCPSTSGASRPGAAGGVADLCFVPLLRP